METSASSIATISAASQTLGYLTAQKTSASTIDARSGQLTLQGGIYAGRIKLAPGSTLIVKGGAINGTVELGEGSRLRVDVYPFSLKLGFKGVTELLVVAPHQLPELVVIERPEQLLNLNIPVGSWVYAGGMESSFDGKESIVMVNVGSPETRVSVTELPSEPSRPTNNPTPRSVSDFPSGLSESTSSGTASSNSRLSGDIINRPRHFSRFL